jgi:hypothetical protein
MAMKKKASAAKGSTSKKMAGLTPAQKKLPPFIQSAILKKKKKK